MNILRHFALGLLLVSASIHAMEDQETNNHDVVPYDYAQHHDAAVKLWERRYYCLPPPTAFSDPSLFNSEKTNIATLIKKCTDADYSHTVPLGFVVHDPTLFRYHCDVGRTEVSLTASTEIRYLITNAQNECDKEKYLALLRSYIYALNTKNKDALDIEKITIEPFTNYKNSEPIVDLFQRTFPNSSVPTVLTNRAHPTKKNIDILIKTTRSDRRNILVGFIIYKSKKFNLAVAENPWRRNISSGNLCNIAATYIQYVAIHPEDRRKGFGKMLMEHAARQQYSDYIHLMPTLDTKDFFKKLWYRESGMSGLPEEYGMVRLNTRKAMALYNGKDYVDSKEIAS